MFLLLLNIALAAHCPDKVYALFDGQSWNFYYNANLPGTKEVDESALVNCKPDWRIIKIQGDKYVLDVAKKALADAEDAAEATKENNKKALIVKAKNKSLTNAEADELLKLLAERL